MTNFNGINPWLNALNYLSSVKQNQNAANNSQTQNSAPIEQNQTSQLIQNLSANVFKKTPSVFLVNQTQQEAVQNVLKMDNEIVQKYLQSLLDMPESLDKFLQKANLKELDSNSHNFIKLFLEGMINNKELTSLLKQNSNDAIQKLLNVITQSLKSGADSLQLKEILSVLNTIHTTTSVSSNTLRELFLLYIPINYQVFKEESDFASITNENEEGIKESVLSILLETQSFSNILAILNNADGIITIELRADKDFPFDKFKNIVTTEAKESSIKIACDFLKIKEYGEKGKKQNFKIISDNFVPVNVLNVSNMVIKAIFKIDKDLSEISE